MLFRGLVHTLFMCVLVIVENRISFWNIFADPLGLFSGLFPFLSIYVYAFLVYTYITVLVV